MDMWELLQEEKEALAGAPGEYLHQPHNWVTVQQCKDCEVIQTINLVALRKAEALTQRAQAAINEAQEVLAAAAAVDASTRENMAARATAANLSRVAKSFATSAVAASESI